LETLNLPDNNPKIFLTGSAGFIGYHLAQSLLDDGYEVMGIDNINDYYDPILKEKRLINLKKRKNFDFVRIDINDYDSLKRILLDFKPATIVNLAAQAGVRYSIENPYAYISSNILGFYNIIESCRKLDIQNLIYASSSSVYGLNKKIPFSVDDKIDKPISLYASSKAANELIAHSYSNLYGINTTGLRFFTVYGPWGRPDMAMYIFTDKISNNQKIQVFNNGDMKRDFTFIDDIISGIRASIDKCYKYEIFNLGNNRSENLMDMIGLIEKKLNKKAIIEYKPMQPGDVRETFADIEHSTKRLNYSPNTTIEKGIPKFIDWYLGYNKKRQL
tara:strand:+ start:534 stop:1526 length:993 start_codon:yes stop_codon:yes gene_type:complete